MFLSKKGVPGGGGSKRIFAVIGVLLAAAGGTIVGPALGIQIPDFLGIGAMATGLILVGIGAAIVYFSVPQY